MLSDLCKVERIFEGTTMCSKSPTVWEPDDAVAGQDSLKHTGDITNMVHTSRQRYLCPYPASAAWAAHLCRDLGLFRHVYPSLSARKMLFTHFLHLIQAPSSII